MIEYDRDETAWGAVAVSLVGVLLLLVTVRTHAEIESLTVTFPSLVLDLGVLGAGVWLSDADDMTARRSFRWISGFLLAFGVLLGTLVLLWRLPLDSALILADTTAIAIIGGVVLGAVTTRERHPSTEFDALFHDIPHPTFAVDTTGSTETVAAVNPAFEERFDMSVDDVRGDPLSEFVIDERERQELPYATPTDQAWGGTELTLEVGQEKQHFVQLDAPITGHDGLYDDYDLYRNVTEQRQREERLNVLSRTLRHDIRNKMTAIEGNLSVIKESPDHPKREQMFESMERASTSILSMSERAYEIEQALSGNQERTTFDLRERVDAALASFREEYPDVEFVLDGPETARATGTEAVSEAIQELLDNAVKHNDTETPHVEVQLTDEPDNGAVHLSVRDNGSGISDEERNVLVGDTDRSKLNHLDGLGLWFVNWVVRDSGGSLEIEENEPCGTVVTMSLPRADE